MSKFQFYNPNPTQRYRRDGKPMGWHKGDCHIRAVAKALDISWEDTLKLEYEEALKQHDSAGSRKVMDAILLRNGFKKGVMPKGWMRVNGTPTIKDFLDEELNSDKDFVFYVNGHVATAKKGVLYDCWNCSNEYVQRYLIR